MSALAASPSLDTVIDDRFIAGIKQRTGTDIIIAYDSRPMAATVNSRGLHVMGTSIRPVEFDASTEGAGRLALSVALDEAPQRGAFWPHRHHRCARAANGHATTAPPASVMNWRRFN